MHGRTQCPNVATGQGLEECMKNKRLPADWAYPQVADRISTRVDPDYNKLPPFSRAAMDWGHEIVKSKLQEVTELSLAHPLGDINQSPSRFTLKMNGMCPTLTSRSTIFDFKGGQLGSNTFRTFFALSLTMSIEN